MQRKLFLLACAAGLAAASPAEATLKFELFRPNNQSAITCYCTPEVGTQAAGQADFFAHYTPITGPINLAAGSQMIVTVVLHQTDSLGADTFADNPGNVMIGYGFGLRYVPGVLVHQSPVGVYTGNSAVDTTAGLNYNGFMSQPNVYTDIPGASRVYDVSLGGYFTPSTYYVVTSFRLQALVAGSGSLQIFRPSSGEYIGSPTSGMDALIFSHAPGGSGGVYNFPVVVPVPEPTCITAIGLLAVVVGYRVKKGVGNRFGRRGRIGS